MSSYGQFCAVARAHEALGGRWTLLFACSSTLAGALVAPSVTLSMDPLTRSW